MFRTSGNNRGYFLLSQSGLREELEEHFERLGVTDKGRELVLKAFERPVRRGGAILATGVAT